jgi:hypothetical protein
VWTDGTTLAVSDTFGGSAAVYVWNDFWAGGSAGCARPPSFALTAAGQMQAPRGIWSDGTRLFVSESNRRGVPAQSSRGVFVWNRFPNADLGPDAFLLTSANGSGAPQPPPVGYQGDFISAQLHPTPRLGVWCGKVPGTTRAADFYLKLPPLLAGMADGSGMDVAGQTLFVAPSSSNVVVGFELPLHRRFGVSRCGDVTGATRGCSLQDGDVACQATPDVTVSEIGTRSTRFIMSHGNPQSDGSQLLIVSSYDSTLHGYRPVPTGSGPVPTWFCNLLSRIEEVGFYGAKGKLYEGRYSITGTNGILHWTTTPTSSADCEGAIVLDANRLSLTGTHWLLDVDWGGGSAEGLYLAYLATDGSLRVAFYASAIWQSIEGGGRAGPTCTTSLGAPGSGDPSRISLSANATRLAVNTTGDVVFYDISESPCPSGELGRLNAAQPGDRFDLTYTLGVVLSEDGKVFVSDTQWSRVLYWTDVRQILAGSPPSAVLGTPDGARALPDVSESRLTLPAYLGYDARSGLLLVGEHDWGSRVLIFDGRLR